MFGRPSSSRRWSTGGPPIASPPLGMLRVVKMDRSVEECVPASAPIMSVRGHDQLA
jgi:hypothetical protein